MRAATLPKAQENSGKARERCAPKKGSPMLCGASTWPLPFVRCHDWEVRKAELWLPDWVAVSKTPKVSLIWAQSFRGFSPCPLVSWVCAEHGGKHVAEKSQTHTVPGSRRQSGSGRGEHTPENPPMVTYILQPGPSSQGFTASREDRL